MKRDDTTHLGTAAGEFEYRRPAKAVADGRNFPGVDPGILLQRFERSIDAQSQEWAVGLELTRELAGHLGELRRLPVAVQVDSERHVAELRQHLGSMLRIVVESPPLRTHKDSRPLALRRI